MPRLDDGKKISFDKNLYGFSVTICGYYLLLRILTYKSIFLNILCRKTHNYDKFKPYKELKCLHGLCLYCQGGWMLPHVWPMGQEEVARGDGV